MFSETGTRRGRRPRRVRGFDYGPRGRRGNRRRRKGDQRLAGHDLRHRRLEAVVDDGAGIEFARRKAAQHAIGNIARGLERETRPANLRQAIDDEPRMIATQ